MFSTSNSFQTADFDVKRSFNTLKLIFLTEEVFLITCTKYYKNITTKNQNNSNIVK